jgi:hypothetical protein
MSLRSIPLIVLAFIFYNVVVVLGGGASADVILKRELFSIPMVGRSAPITWGDLIITVTLVLLFIEITKSTYTSSASLLDHAFSMIVFIACLVEFLLVANAATGVFFNVTLATLIDVVAGYTIGIRVARRDLSIGSDQ